MSARDRGLLQADLLLDAEIGGEPVAPSDDLRAAVLRSVAPDGALAGFGRRVAELFDLAEARALELLALVPRASEAPWVPAPLPDARAQSSVRLLHFAGGPRVAEADCGFVSIAPGARFPEHTHEGDEWVLVLSGAAEEEGSGATWLPGDLVLRSAGSRHAFRITSRGPLVFAVVLEGPIRMVEASGAR